MPSFSSHANQISSIGPLSQKSSDYCNNPRDLLSESVQKLLMDQSETGAVVAAADDSNLNRDRQSKDNSIRQLERFIMEAGFQDDRGRFKSEALANERDGEEEEDKEEGDGDGDGRYRDEAIAMPSIQI